MRRLVHYFVVGIGFGSAAYILNLLIFQFTPTWSNVLVTWLFSGLMGLATLIFNWETKHAWLIQLLHLASIFGLVLLMLVLNGWYVPAGREWFGFVLSFSMIYLAIYLYLLWLNWQSVQKINGKLQAGRNNS